jgi:hypothetical protein
MFNIPFGTGEKVVQAQDIVPCFDQSVTEMGAQKAGTAGDKYSFLIVFHFYNLSQKLQSL